MRNCKIHDDLLYVNNRFYVSNNSKLHIKIIKDIYNTSFDDYVNRLFINNRLFRYNY